MDNQSRQEARAHLDWCVTRALEYYDAGDERNAMTSFMSDVRKHDGTLFIFANPLLMPILQDGLNGGREQFKTAMEGFNV